MKISLSGNSVFKRCCISFVFSSSVVLKVVSNGTLGMAVGTWSAAVSALLFQEVLSEIDFFHLMTLPWMWFFSFTIDLFMKSCLA